MGVWVTRVATGEIVDYSLTGSIVYDPRFFTNHAGIDLPPGDDPKTYHWTGAAIVKNPPTQADVNKADLQAKLAAIQVDPGTPQRVKDFTASLKTFLGI